MDCFSGTFDADLIGKRSYQNINFSLTGYLIGVYTKPSILTNTNAIANSTPVAEKDRVFTIASGLQMDSFINDKVFKLVPGKISASCDAANEYQEHRCLCLQVGRRQGQWHHHESHAVRQAVQRRWRILDVDPRLRQFRCPRPASNEIISASTRKMLYNDQMASSDDRMVWSSKTSDTWIKDKFEMSNIIWSGGDQNYGGGQAAHTSIVRLPLGYVVLVFANSDELLAVPGEDRHRRLQGRHGAQLLI